MLSPVRRLSSVTPVHPTQAVQIFGSFLRHLVPWSSVGMHRKFYGDPSGTAPSEELNPRGVAKYSDFAPIEGYISETVQDMR